MKIGVLAAQGAFAEHLAVLKRLEIDAVPVRLPGELSALDGLIIPGGESTTICRLMDIFGLTEKIKERAREGMAIWGTCAGMILLAKELADADSVVPLGLMDIEVKRNAFGRQLDSFEADLSIPVLGEQPFPCVFIRAPFIEQVKNGGEVLARLEDGTVVATRQKKLLATAFHPELTSDLRFHQYFLDIAAGRN